MRQFDSGRHLQFSSACVIKLPSCSSGELCFSEVLPHRCIPDGTFSVSRPSSSRPSREAVITPLSPQQERELAEVRQELQAISRQDERAQSAARQMKEVNASLGALEAQVDARIAQREAEQRGETGQPA